MDESRPFDTLKPRMSGLLRERLSVARSLVKVPDNPDPHTGFVKPYVKVKGDGPLFADCVQASLTAHATYGHLLRLALLTLDDASNTEIAKENLDLPDWIRLNDDSHVVIRVPGTTCTCETRWQRVDELTYADAGFGDARFTCAAGAPHTLDLDRSTGIWVSLIHYAYTRAERVRQAARLRGVLKEQRG